MAAPPSAQQIPALHLYPLNDSFVPKQISLAQGKVKIGRQTNARTVPGERNGFFDSKVLSRMHAEVWEENGKILIKDVKSSNGTFINSERLSPEGVESEPFELKSEDIVEFGIDIVGEDNRTIVHHKVAAKVYCILSPDDLLASQREMQYLRNPSNRLPHPVINGSNGGVPPNGQPVNGQGQGMPNGQPPPQQQQQQQAQGQTLGGMGGARVPGKSGLTFDHLLSRLQGEIVKSRETGSELGMIGREMGEIGETLSGGLPQHPPPPPSHHPHHQQQQQMAREMPPSSSSPPNSNPSGPPSQLLNTLQSQLHETRLSLSAHSEKVRTLEGLLAEQESLRREVRGMREMVEESRRMVEGWRVEREGSGGGGAGGLPFVHLGGSAGSVGSAYSAGVVQSAYAAGPVGGAQGMAAHAGGEEEEEDMDDSKSVMTVTPGDSDDEDEHLPEPEEGAHPPPPSQGEEHAVPPASTGEETHTLESEQVSEGEGMHRPKTPEPTGHGLDDDEREEEQETADADAEAGAQQRLAVEVPPVSETVVEMAPVPVAQPEAQPQRVEDEVPPVSELPSLPTITAVSPPAPAQPIPAPVQAEFISRSEHAGHLSSLMTQISDLSLQLSTALALSKELASQQEVIRQLEERLQGWEEWKRTVDERVGGIAGQVEVVQAWKVEREEERQRAKERDEEGWASDGERRDQLHALRESGGAGEELSAGSEEEGVPAQAPRPRRRRKSRGGSRGAVNGTAHVVGGGSARSATVGHGSSSPSSSSSETRAIPGRRHMTKVARVRSESQSTAVGSDNPHNKDKERDGSEGDTLVESLPDVDEAGEKSLVDSPVSGTFPGGVPTEELKAAGKQQQRRLAGEGKEWAGGAGAVTTVLVPVAVVIVAGIAAWAVVNRARE